MSRPQRLTLVATILASTVVFLDATVVNVALPAMQRDLGMGLAGQQWVVEAYLLALVSLMLVGGSLGDHFGRRRIFSIGLAGFGVTSVLCALAPSTGVLIAMRGIQGLAGALTSALWIRDPKRKPDAVPPTPRAATAGECARASRTGDQEPEPGVLDPAPEATEAPL